MATLKIIRKRISSVKNTQKITKAMKMVAAARLRRAQTALLQARPYEKNLAEVLKRLGASLDPEDSLFLKEAEGPRPAVLMVLSSDRGLCGGFNSNLLRQVHYSINFEMRQHSEVGVYVFGRKGREFFRSRKIPIKKEVVGLSDKFSFAQSMENAEEILGSFREGKVGAFYLAYNGFKSAISQEIRIRKILPLEIDRSHPEEALWPVIYEPSALALFHALLPLYVADQIHLAHLESNTSELGARMSAMENATTNAKEMISRLTLLYNRARQAAITKELMDIVNGAEALK